MPYSIVKLNSLCDIKGGKRLPKGADFVQEGYKYIRARDIKAGAISFNQPVYIDEATRASIKRYTVSARTVCVTIVGANVGDAGIVPDYLDQANLTENAAKLVNLRGIDPFYLNYYLQTNGVKEQLRIFSTGSAQDKLALYKLGLLDVILPSFKDQRKIVAIVKAYDDLIENNKKRIQILENMAEEQYKEWFVRFRFPNWENTEFDKGVPATFKIKKISEVYKTASGGTPSRKVDEYFVGDINWFKTGELKSLYTFESEEKISEIAVEKSAAKLLPKDTVVIAMYCAMPDISILSQPSCINQACCAFLSKKEQISHIYTYYLIKNAQVELIKYAHGAAQQNLSQELIQNFSILIAPNELRNQFHNLLEPLFEQIKILNQQIFNLDRQKRDLLPRLISGKLSVEDLDVQFPPSMLEQ